jgi:hypothetical protein
MCNAINECDALFSSRTVFSLGFRMEFLMRHVHIVVIAQGECCKTYGLYPKRKGEGEILILVRLYVGSYQTLSTWALTKLLDIDRTIYTWGFYIVIINIQKNKE